MAIPTKDSELVPYTINFDTRLTATPATFGATSAIALAYKAVNDPYVAAMEALDAAKAAGNRSSSLAATKNTARNALLDYARPLYATIQASASVTDANKILIGVHIRKTEPTPVPTPAAAPGVAVDSVNGRVFAVRLFDADEPTRRGRPPGVTGAAVFSHVGETAPAAIEDWVFEGNTGRTEINVIVPSTIAPGTKVWFTAFWFNNRKASGPATAPLSAHTQFGGEMATAA